MPRLSKPTRYPAAEVLYATADALVKARQNPARAELLQDRLEYFVREDYARHLLLQTSLHVTKLPHCDAVKLTVVDERLPSSEARNTYLEHLVEAFREVI